MERGRRQHNPPIEQPSRASGSTWRQRAAVAGALVCALIACALAGWEPRPAAAGPPAPGFGAPTATSAGYWLASGDGGAFAFGGAAFAGSAGDRRLVRPVVGMAATPTGRGYWLVAADGGVFAFGDALFAGSTGDRRLVRPVVGMAATPTGRGYWLVAADGGIFAFGDAPFLGSMGGRRLSGPVVGMAATPSGRGYWLVAADGGIFNFGDAVFAGSAAGRRPPVTAVGLARTPDGQGYWVATAEGDVFGFGSAPPLGSPFASGVRPGGAVVAVAASPRGLGYWLVATDGGVFAYGDAAFAGSLGGRPLVAPVVAVAAPPVLHSAGVGAFYYPWYANLQHDGGWRHWEQGGHQPPVDLGANDYPARGAYSSNDPDTLAAQAAEMAAAGIDQVVSSWWGRNDFEDWNLPLVADAVHDAGLDLAIHIEPYKRVGPRSPATLAADLDYLRRYGVSDVYLYEIADRPPEEWAAVTAAFPDYRFFAETGDLGSVLAGTFADYARRAGFDGVYTYEAVRYGRAELATACGWAFRHRLLCSPSVAPGYVAFRAKPWDAQFVDRAAGARYDTIWDDALAAGADLVTITSYNEWHEGTQIEGARPYCFPDGYCSPGYQGAYGRSGAAAERAYLDRTAEWSARLRAIRSR